MRNDYNEKIIPAKADMSCALCGETIKRNDKMLYAHGVDAGHPFGYCICLTCKALRDEFPEVCYDFDGYLSDYDVAEYMSYYKCKTAEELLTKLREERDNAGKQKTDNLG